MEGGEIVIEGDAGDFVGGNMEDGEIMVKGCAGNHIGDDMEGGKIYIGKLQDPRKQISETAEKGRIYKRILNPELVWENGEFV
jgi:formylmethanofuran dehydrogenase subunit C